MRLVAGAHSAPGLLDRCIAIVAEDIAKIELAEVKSIMVRTRAAALHCQ